MSTDYIDNIIDDVSGPISYDPTDATHLARILRWVNACINENMMEYNWPELITHNATFTTDGSQTYDLTSEIGATFWRVIDKSVRISTRQIPLVAKQHIDSFDPNRTRGDVARYCWEEGNQVFGLWPAESTGSTVYLDWLAKPATLTDSTTDALFPFTLENHGVIRAGALWRGKQFEGYDDAKSEEMSFYRRLKDKFHKSNHVRMKPTQANAIQF